MENESIGNVATSSGFSLITLLGEADIIVKLVLVALLLA